VTRFWFVLRFVCCLSGVFRLASTGSESLLVQTSGPLRNSCSDVCSTLANSGGQSLPQGNCDSADIARESWLLPSCSDRVPLPRRERNLVRLLFEHITGEDIDKAPAAVLEAASIRDRVQAAGECALLPKAFIKRFC
jgi:hypothetical protein